MHGHIVLIAGIGGSVALLGLKLSLALGTRGIRREQLRYENRTRRLSLSLRAADGVTV